MQNITHACHVNWLGFSSVFSSFSQSDKSYLKPTSTANPPCPLRAILYISYYPDWLNGTPKRSFKQAKRSTVGKVSYKPASSLDDFLAGREN